MEGGLNYIVICQSTHSLCNALICHERKKQAECITPALLPRSPMADIYFFLFHVDGLHGCLSALATPMARPAARGPRAGPGRAGPARPLPPGPLGPDWLVSVHTTLFTYVEAPVGLRAGGRVYLFRVEADTGGSGKTNKLQVTFSFFSVSLIDTLAVARASIFQLIIHGLMNTLPHLTSLAISVAAGAGRSS